MASLKKKIVDGNTYFYLEHSFRKDGKVLKREKYLGTAIPPNIDAIKREFVFGFYVEKWYSILDAIKINTNEEKKHTPKSALRKEEQTFAVKFTYNTNRIEGSTLSLRETADLLERGITPAHKPIADIKETEAHQKVFHEMLNYQKDFSLNIILYWHRQLFKDTKPDIAGKLRTHQVAISGSKFMPPLASEVEFLCREFIGWYNLNKKTLHPVELAAGVHLKFVTIHPFSDGNGRISRLLMNFVLNKSKFPMLDIPYTHRSGYYTALERSQIKKEEGIFVYWLFRRYIKEYQHYSR
jgi:Fic family protein